jgi:AAA15 family ATPase/GTPase
VLIEFRVENHRSIRDEQALTLEAGRVGASEDPRPRQVQGCAKKILPVAAIYGANASGKSNVLAAIGSMREAVVFSLRNWSPDEGIPQDPFAWGAKSTEATSFEVQIVIEGTRYRYGFKFNEKVFLEEWLYAWPNGKKQTWLERVEETYTFGENLRGENKVIEDVTRPNALFLSAAAQLKHPQLSPIYTWFGSIETINLAPRRSLSGPSFFMHHGSENAIASMIEESNQTSLFPDLNPALSMANRFKALLKNADVGIEDVRATRREQAGRSRPWQIEVKHQNETTDAWLPLEEESKGTRTLFRLALPVLRAIDRGRILVVDELESSMHPNLAEHIVSQFNDPQINIRNAQLIFTTHDTNLLGTLFGEPVLRRDQVWLTEKDGNGASVLYPLTDFKPRKEENVERGYIQGRYGAIPYLGNFRIPTDDTP